MTSDSAGSSASANAGKVSVTRLSQRERNAKHVKALMQVGDVRSPGFDRELRYPAKLMPLDNPYSLRPGQLLRVRALVGGQPVARQFVEAGGRTPSGQRLRPWQGRTDADGVARIPLQTRGIFYVKFIHMSPSAADSMIDYESKWATLTFAMR